jgi:hypothetical protein
VVVVRTSDRFEVLATDTLTDQSFISSPAIVDGDIYLRSRTHMFRVSEDASPDPGEPVRRWRTPDA